MAGAWPEGRGVRTQPDGGGDDWGARSRRGAPGAGDCRRSGLREGGL